MTGTIDEIRIEGEENGFHLVIFTDDGETHRYRIGLPDQFRAETERTIGNWLYEGEAARDDIIKMRVVNIATGEDVSGQYVTGPAFPPEPKDPDYHDKMSALYDNREGK